MNRVALLSNGPSATEFGHTTRQYDVVIGVNWTCLTWKCDWVCAFDGVTFADAPGDIRKPHHPPRLCGADGKHKWWGQPKFFVHWHVMDWLRLNRPDVAATMSHEYVMTWPAKDKDFLYSGSAPLHLMHLLGLTAADCWGYDMAGELDHTGLENPSRQPSRWERERKHFYALAERWALDLNLMA